nr:NADH dehydrogenase subunit 11b [Gomphonema parvulum]
MLSQNYSFIQLRRAENFRASNDLEKNFQLNVASNKIKLNNSTLCLLISNNPRYEGYYLNLNLRQRFLKGNFKCLSIGSFIDLTFPVTFLGSNVGVLKSIAEGNNLICQDLKGSKNPLIIFNNELFKRNDHSAIKQVLENMNFYTNSNKFNGLNNLNPSLSETGLNVTNNFLPLTLKDLNNFSLLYFINITSINIANLKKITELNLLNYNYKLKSTDNLILDQNYKLNHNYTLTDGLNFSNYLHLPTSVFYENEETFVNTEGFIKRTTKLISRKHTRNNWQIIRKLFKHLKKNFVSLELKNNNLIFFNSNKIISFKNYINFNYYATQNLTNLNFYLSVKTTPIVFTNKSMFKTSSNKLKNSKLKYWLDDFFTGGKDEYSQNSLILTNCSKILRSETTNFF